VGQATLAAVENTHGAARHHRAASKLRSGNYPRCGYSLDRAELVGRYVLKCPIHHWGFRRPHWLCRPALVGAGRQPKLGRRLKLLPVRVIDDEIFVDITRATATRGAAGQAPGESVPCLGQSAHGARAITQARLSAPIKGWPE
jgi:hypothetical protein